MSERRSRVYDDEELLEHLRELADGKAAPTKREILSAEGPVPTTYRNHFGTLASAIDQAGLERTERYRSGVEPTYSESELLNHLRELSEGEVAPTTTEVNRVKGPSAATYTQRFGEYGAAVEQAGLDLPTQRQYTDEELLDWIRSFVAEFGVVPRSKDAQEWSGPAPRTYHRRFDSWRAAVHAAVVESAGGENDE